MLARFHVPLSWRELLKRTFNEAIADDLLSLAAQQAYYFFFALFPALLALVALASFFPIVNVSGEITAWLDRIAPKEVVQIISEGIARISNADSGGILTFAFLLTLWSSSAAMLAMITTLNTAYDVTESRPWWKVRLIGIGLTIGMAFFILLSMTLILAGPTLAQYLADQLGLGAAFEWSWKILQWPVVFVLVATGIALIYYFAPDVEQDWVWITPGSIFATALWVLVSLGFKFYLTTLGGQSTYDAYGVIGAVMILMLWFYLSGLAILLGAELNAEIEHASPHGKDVGERVPGEKKKVGAAAERAAEEVRAKGEMLSPLFPEGVNCDIDMPARRSEERARPSASDLLIGAAALLPVAIKIGRDVKRRLQEERRDRAA